MGFEHIDDDSIMVCFTQIRDEMCINFSGAGILDFLGFIDQLVYLEAMLNDSDKCQTFL